MAKRNFMNTVKLSTPKRNLHDLSHDVKLSFNMGELVPIMCTEAIPGDRFNISMESLLRFAPLVAPVMHRMNISAHFFFVPNRIVWPNWEKFIVRDGTHAVPYIQLDGTTASGLRLMNYMGIPRVTSFDSEKLNAIPFAAYQKVWNEFYRDQNLITEIDPTLIDGDNTGVYSMLTALRKRAWEHDYFTSALPWPQKGSQVDVPIAQGTVELDMTKAGLQSGVVRQSSDFTTIDTGNVISDGSQMAIGANGQVYDPNGTLKVDAGATSINELRRAFRLQEWLERNARGGTRYIENILAHFGVKSSDKRLQRPEYITGTVSPVVISEVLNTAGTGGIPQGNMAGHGISVTNGKNGKYFVEEHGFIIGVISVLPKTGYYQGIPKKFLKIDDPFQYYWPSFAHIGEQPIEKREIWGFQGIAGKSPFGYTPRYAEYRFEQNRVAGDFAGSLEFWHLDRKFAAPPSLNQAFIEADPTHRVFAVTDPNAQKLWCHVYNKVLASRLIPKFGTPML